MMSTNTGATKRLLKGTKITTDNINTTAVQYNLTRRQVLRAKNLKEKGVPGWE